MNYLEAVDYLLAIPKFAKKTTKENLLYLLERLGNPQEYGKAIHVAGTNGKGSTSAYMQAILIEEGYQVGLFTSPHLVCINERFRINGLLIGDTEFLDIFLAVKKEMDDMISSGHPHVSFFEFLFVMGALYFCKNKTDYCIYETGLGGRLDATNVLNPQLCVITSIGLDHTEYLGHTIELIAAEKAGIIKQHVPVVFMNENDVVEKVMTEMANMKQAPCYGVNTSDYKITEKTNKSIAFSLNSRYYKNDMCKLSTMAKYQAGNASLAVIAVITLLPGVAEQSILQGLKKMIWPGRMEELEDGIIIDGAHNLEAIVQFVDTVSDCYKDKKKVLLFAAVSDKDYTNMIEYICENLVFEQIVITKVDNIRGVNTSAIGEVFHTYGGMSKGCDTPIQCIETVEEAYNTAKTYVTKDTQLFCVGSLYLVGSLKEIGGHND